jgi:hypothetical protein
VTSARVEPEPAIERVAAVLRELVAALHANTRAVELLRVDLARRRRRPSRRGLLAAIAPTVNHTEFTSAEVIEHAAIVPPLAAVLEAAHVTNARQLGRALRTIEGDAIDGYALQRIGVDHDGAIIWRVRRV